MTESKADRLDRELAELLQELRVLLPGVQVLFAFLLTLPFTTGFPKTSDAERALFFAAFALTAFSAVLLVAPGVRHRTRFRVRDKEALITSANRLTLTGTVALALAITLVVTLIAEFLYGWVAGVVSGVLVLLLAGWCWYGWSAMRALGDRTSSPASSR
jgi:hypothetical protein